MTAVRSRSRTDLCLRATSPGLLLLFFGLGSSSATSSAFTSDSCAVSTSAAGGAAHPRATSQPQAAQLDLVRHFRGDLGGGLRRRRSRFDAFRFVRHRRDGSIRAFDSMVSESRGGSSRSALVYRGGDRRFRRRFRSLGLHRKEPFGADDPYPASWSRAAGSVFLGSACDTHRLVIRKQETEVGAFSSRASERFLPACPHCDARDRHGRHARPVRERARAEDPEPFSRWASARLDRHSKQKKAVSASAWRAPAYGIAQRWHPLMNGR